MACILIFGALSAVFSFTKTDPPPASADAVSSPAPPPPAEALVEGPSQAKPNPGVPSPNKEVGMASVTAAKVAAPPSKPVAQPSKPLAPVAGPVAAQATPSKPAAPVTAPVKPTPSPLMTARLLVAEEEKQGSAKLVEKAASAPSALAKPSTPAETKPVPAPLKGVTAAPTYPAVKAIHASPLVPPKPVVVMATREKAWVKVDERRTVVVTRNGDAIPGLGKMVESDGKTVKFENETLSVSTE